MKNIFFNIIFLVTLQACAQTGRVVPTPADTQFSNDSFTLIKNIPGHFVLLQVDAANNIYLVTAGGQLKKYNASGDSIAIYNNVKQYGNPSLVDVSNPLRTLLYYPSFATIVMLDRLLGSRNVINLRQHNIFTVNTIAGSYDNNLWIFDEQNFQLAKMDETGKLLLQSTDWRLLMNDVPQPTQIIDHANFVYLYDEGKGFYLFDYYGTFKTHLPFAGWKNIAVSNGRISGFVGNALHIYLTATLQEKIYPLPAVFNNYQGARAVNGLLYLLKPDGLWVYQMKP